MARRIEQSRRHGHYDPRWTGVVYAVSESPLPAATPEDPIVAPPTLTLVGGTDVTPEPGDQEAVPRA